MNNRVIIREISHAICPKLASCEVLQKSTGINIYIYTYLLSPSRDHRATNVTESKSHVYLSPLYDSIVVCQEVVGQSSAPVEGASERESRKKGLKSREVHEPRPPVSVLSLVNLEFLAVSSINSNLLDGSSRPPLLFSGSLSIERNA